MNNPAQEQVYGQEWLDGIILLIDKPLEWTSFQIVKKIRSLLTRKYKFKKIKVGHAGTLDPLASGLMIIGTGKATKQLESLQGLEKEYLAEIKLGATTPSSDLETEIDKVWPVDHISESDVLKLTADLTGEQDQVPPLFSAKKIGGVRAYELARKGSDRVLEANRVVIHELELLKCHLPDLSLRVVCSKGTYIRALARDIGIALHSGAHLVGLQRTRIGEHTLQNAESIEDFEKRIHEL